MGKGKQDSCKSNDGGNDRELRKALYGLARRQCKDVIRINAISADPKVQLEKAREKFLEDIQLLAIDQGCDELQSEALAACMDQVVELEITPDCLERVKRSDGNRPGSTAIRVKPGEVTTSIKLKPDFRKNLQRAVKSTTVPVPIALLQTGSAASSSASTAR